MSNPFSSSSYENLDSEDVISSQNFYEVLELSQDASRVQIREAYIRMKNTYSQENRALYSLISDEDLEGALERLDQAYGVLYDEHKRKAYDENLVQDAPSDSVEGKSVESKSLSRQSDPWVQEGDNKPVKKRQFAQSMRFSGSSLNEATQGKIQALVDECEAYDGNFLKCLREIQDVTLDELQGKTKVSLQYIIALENNDFQTLPSVVYVKGFLKICLQYLGVQKGIDKIVSDFVESYKGWQQSKGID